MDHAKRKWNLLLWWTQATSKELLANLCARVQCGLGLNEQVGCTRRGGTHVCGAPRPRDRPSRPCRACGRGAAPPPAPRSAGRSSPCRASPGSSPPPSSPPETRKTERVRRHSHPTRVTRSTLRSHLRTICSPGCNVFFAQILHRLGSFETMQKFSAA